LLLTGRQASSTRFACSRILSRLRTGVTIGLPVIASRSHRLASACVLFARFLFQGRSHRRPGLEKPVYTRDSFRRVESTYFGVAFAVKRGSLPSLQRLPLTPLLRRVERSTLKRFHYNNAHATASVSSSLRSATVLLEIPSGEC